MEYRLRYGDLKFLNLEIRGNLLIFSLVSAGASVRVTRKSEFNFGIRYKANIVQKISSAGILKI